MNETLGITATEESQKRPNRATGRRGRKPTAQSHAAEIRGKLAAWKQTPESVRPSLRVLARQIGTSHQLLSHYLQGWDKWQAKVSVSGEGNSRSRGGRDAAFCQRRIVETSRGVRLGGLPVHDQFGAGRFA